MRNILVRGANAPKNKQIMAFPWGAIIGLAGQAVSGIASGRNNRKMQQAADAEAERQKAYYEAKANENPLSRSENARLLGQYDRKAQQQIDAARGVASITGATPEYSLSVQKAVAEGRADLMGGMAAEASERKDKYEDKAETAEHQKFLDDQTRRAERNNTYANLAANAASAAGSIMDSYTAGRQKVAAVPSVSKTPAQVATQQRNLQTVTNENAPKSERYAAASRLAGGATTPEGTVLQTTANAAQNAQKLATGTAAATTAPTVDVEPDPSDFLAHQEWERRHNKPAWQV